MKMRLFLLLCVLAIVSAQNPIPPSVNIAQGVVTGTYISDGDFFAYYGIPYAGRTSGTNRFKAPPPPDGTLQTGTDNIVCAHPTSNGIVGVEDCLVVNIQTKDITTPKPVFVWLEGEEYAAVSEKPLSFKNLIKEDVVVVSLNYRLSIFGFLCLGVPEAPGNAGLKDVIRGLKWVKDNIASFGGDPENVILIGHGSGAAMVDLVTLSAKSKNLVHKAIALSGSALAPWAVSYDPVTYAERYGDQLGYTGQTGRELAISLATTNIDAFSSEINSFEFYNNTPLFAPCIESENSEESVLVDAPINIIRSGDYNHIPFIAAYTDREGTIRAKQAAELNWLSQMETTFSNFLQADLEFKTVAERTNVSRHIREFYFGSKIIDMSAIDNFFKYQGDSLILFPVMRGAKERSLTSKADVRLLEFAYQGTLNSDWKYPNIALTGARHGAFLNYIFDYDLKSTGDGMAREALINRLIAFALTGAPTPEGQSVWPPITDTFNMLHMSGGEISENFTFFQELLRTNLNSDSTRFWDDIYANHYEPPLPVSSAKALAGYGLLLLICQIAFLTFRL